MSRARTAGTPFTASVKEAWTAAYLTLAGAMKKAADEMEPPEKRCRAG